MNHKTKANRRRLERVTVRGELRQEPDWDRFAWALLRHAQLVNRGRPSEQVTRAKGESR